MRKLRLTPQGMLSKWLELIPTGQRFWLLTGLVSLLTGLIAFQFIYSPAQARHRTISTELLEEEQRLELLRGIASKERELGQLSQSLLHEGGAATMIQKVTQLASQAGLILLSAEPKSSIPAGSYAQVQVEVDARGSFESLCAFLGAVKSQEPLIEIVRLEARGVTDSSVPLSPRSFFPFEGAGSSATSSPTERLKKLTEFLEAKEIHMQVTVAGWTRRLGASS